MPGGRGSIFRGEVINRAGVFDPRAYGALCNGSANDAPGYTAALVEARARGCQSLRLLVPPRTTIKSVVEVLGSPDGTNWHFQNVVLDGEGSGSLKFDAAGNYGFVFNNIESVRLQGLTVEGTTSGSNDALVGFLASTIGQLVVDGLYVFNFAAHGDAVGGIEQCLIHVAGADTDIRNCRFRGCAAKNGLIVLYGWTTASVRRVIFHDLGNLGGLTSVGKTVGLVCGPWITLKNQAVDALWMHGPIFEQLSCDEALTSVIKIDSPDKQIEHVTFRGIGWNTSVRASSPGLWVNNARRVLMEECHNHNGAGAVSSQFARFDNVLEAELHRCRVSQQNPGNTGDEIVGDASLARLYMRDCDGLDLTTLNAATTQYLWSGAGWVEQ